MTEKKKISREFSRSLFGQVILDEEDFSQLDISDELREIARRALAELQEEFRQ